jgi:hypothetical protein
MLVDPGSTGICGYLGLQRIQDIGVLFRNADPHPQTVGDRIEVEGEKRTAASLTFGQITRRCLSLRGDHQVQYGCPGSGPSLHRGAEEFVELCYPNRLLRCRQRACRGNPPAGTVLNCHMPRLNPYLGTVCNPKNNPGLSAIGMPYAAYARVPTRCH